MTVRCLKRLRSNAHGPEQSILSRMQLWHTTTNSRCMLAIPAKKNEKKPQKANVCHFPCYYDCFIKTTGEVIAKRVSEGKNVEIQLEPCRYY